MNAFENLEGLRAWYHAHKDSPECRLALKHRATMSPAVVAELKARAPGASKEEQELALIFALTQVAEKLDSVALLLAQIGIEHLPADDRAFPVSHVDVMPLEVEPADVTLDNEPPPAPTTRPKRAKG